MAKKLPPPDTDTSHLPNRIRQFRLELGLSLADLAERYPGQISPQTLSRLETGKHRLTTLHMDRISKALNKHPTELLNETPGLRLKDAVTTLTPEEKRLVDALRTMSADERQRLLAICKAAAPKHFEG